MKSVVHRLVRHHMERGGLASPVMVERLLRVHFDRAPRPEERAALLAYLRKL